MVAWPRRLTLITSASQAGRAPRAFGLGGVVDMSPGRSSCENARVLLAELSPASRVFPCAFRIALRHDIVWRPDRARLAITGGLDPDFFELNVVGRKQIGIAGDLSDRLPRPGKIGG